MPRLRLSQDFVLCECDVDLLQVMTGGSNAVLLDLRNSFFD